MANEWKELTVVDAGGDLRVLALFTMWNMMSCDFALEHYKGWTVWTMLDRIDNDYSVVTRPGIFNSPCELALEQLRAGTSDNVLTEVSCEGREAAVAWARGMIDVLGTAASPTAVWQPADHRGLSLWHKLALGFEERIMEVLGLQLEDLVRNLLHEDAFFLSQVVMAKAPSWNIDRTGLLAATGLEGGGCEFRVGYTTCGNMDDELRTGDELRGELTVCLDASGRVSYRDVTCHNMPGGFGCPASGGK